jgi:hypothetical protein
MFGPFQELREALDTLEILTGAGGREDRARQHARDAIEKAERETRFYQAVCALRDHTWKT